MPLKGRKGHRAARPKQRRTPKAAAPKASNAVPKTAAASRQGNQEFLGFMDVLRMAIREGIWWGQRMALEVHSQYVMECEAAGVTPCPPPAYRSVEDQRPPAVADVVNADTSLPEPIKAALVSILLATEACISAVFIIPEARARRRADRFTWAGLGFDKAAIWTFVSKVGFCPSGRSLADDFQKYYKSPADVKWHFLNEMERAGRALIKFRALITGVLPSEAVIFPGPDLFSAEPIESTSIGFMTSGVEGIDDDLNTITGATPGAVSGPQPNSFPVDDLGADLPSGGPLPRLANDDDDDDDEDYSDGDDDSSAITEKAEVRGGVTAVGGDEAWKRMPTPTAGPSSSSKSDVAEKHDAIAKADMLPPERRPQRLSVDTVTAVSEKSGPPTPTIPPWRSSTATTPDFRLPAEAPRSPLVTSATDKKNDDPYGKADGTTSQVPPPKIAPPPRRPPESPRAELTPAERAEKKRSRNSPPELHGHSAAKDPAGMSKLSPAVTTVKVIRKKMIPLIRTPVPVVPANQAFRADMIAAKMPMKLDPETVPEDPNLTERAVQLKQRRVREDQERITRLAALEEVAMEKLRSAASRRGGYLTDAYKPTLTLKTLTSTGEILTTPIDPPEAPAHSSPSTAVKIESGSGGALTPPQQQQAPPPPQPVPPTPPPAKAPKRPTVTTVSIEELKQVLAKLPPQKKSPAGEETAQLFAVSSTGGAISVGNIPLGRIAKTLSEVTAAVGTQTSVTAAAEMAKEVLATMHKESTDIIETLGGSRATTEEDSQPTSSAPTASGPFANAPIEIQKRAEQLNETLRQHLARGNSAKAREVAKEYQVLAAQYITSTPAESTPSVTPTSAKAPSKSRKAQKKERKSRAQLLAKNVKATIARVSSPSQHPLATTPPDKLPAFVKASVSQLVLARQRMMELLATPDDGSADLQEKIRLAQESIAQLNRLYDVGEQVLDEGGKAAAAAETDEVKEAPLPDSFVPQEEPLAKRDKWRDVGGEIPESVRSWLANLEDQSSSAEQFASQTHCVNCPHHSKHPDRLAHFTTSRMQFCYHCDTRHSARRHHSAQGRQQPGSGGGASYLEPRGRHQMDGHTSKRRSSTNDAHRLRQALGGKKITFTYEVTNMTPSLPGGEVRLLLPTSRDTDPGIRVIPPDEQPQKSHDFGRRGKKAFGPSSQPGSRSSSLMRSGDSSLRSGSLPPKRRGSPPLDVQRQGKDVSESPKPQTLTPRSILKIITRRPQRATGDSPEEGSPLSSSNASSHTPGEESLPLSPAWLPLPDSAVSPPKEEPTATLSSTSSSAAASMTTPAEHADPQPILPPGQSIVRQWYERVEWIPQPELTLSTLRAEAKRYGRIRRNSPHMSPDEGYHMYVAWMHQMGPEVGERFNEWMQVHKAHKRAIEQLLYDLQENWNENYYLMNHSTRHKYGRERKQRMLNPPETPEERSARIAALRARTRVRSNRIDREREERLLAGKATQSDEEYFMEQSAESAPETNNVRIRMSAPEFLPVPLLHYLSKSTASDGSDHLTD